MEPSATVPAMSSLASTVAYLLGTDKARADALISALSPLCPMDRTSIHVVTDLICEQVNNPPAAEDLHLSF